MRRFLVLSCLCLVHATAFAAQNGDTVVEAKKLYESAQYERALAALERVDATAISPQHAQDRLLYQALCLLALENQSGAEAKAVEILRADPLFTLPRDFPPRLGTLIENVRARLRPQLAQTHYVAGKERFEAGDHAAAVREMTLVIQLASEPAAASDPSLHDVKVLAEGFRDLAQRAIDNPPAPSADGPDAGTTAHGVVPPVVIRQDMPPWPPRLASHFALQDGGSLIGVLEVVVSATGGVKSATLARRIHPVYDALLLAAAKQWKYEPATLEGEPIEYVKRLNIKVSGK